MNNYVMIIIDEKYFSENIIHILIIIRKVTSSNSVILIFLCAILLYIKLATSTKSGANEIALKYLFYFNFLSARFLNRKCQ